MLTKISPKTQNLGQSGPYFLLIACSKFVLKSIHQIAWLQFQKYKIFQLLRGVHPPSDTPLCAQVGIWHCGATQNHHKKSIKKMIYALGLEAPVTLKLGKNLGKDSADNN